MPACHSGRMLLPGAARDQAFRPCTCASQFSVWEWKPTPVPVAPSERIVWMRSERPTAVVLISVSSSNRSPSDSQRLRKIGLASAARLSR